MKRNTTLLVLAAALLATVITSVAVGPVWIAPQKIAAMLANLVVPGNHTWSEAEAIIIFQIRLPRTFMALLVGSGLAVAGVAMQALFKNPLADPYVLGASSGAGFGAALIISLGFVSAIFVPLAAFAGAVIATFTVYALSMIGPRSSVTLLLLSGIAIGTFFSALISYLMFVAGQNLTALVFWLMGGLWASTWQYVEITFPVILVGTIILYAYARDLNLMLSGEESAQHLGVAVENLKRILLVTVSFIVGVAVAFCGIIGFVGLIVPHVVRTFTGPDHKALIPASALFGGILLIWADIVARSAIPGEEMPVGIITALLGAPFFLYLVRSRRKNIF
ncbi:MAG: iron chelate uptake ABC transporter family permease subunit [Halobacteriota archaeon]|jgi:iron complex transport system permease protein